jgi:tetratricopeptide (TPR) repeat protein
MKKTGLLAALLCLAVLPATAQVPDEFMNLKVLPKEIGKRELMSLMRSFSDALGVRCKHCHMGPDDLQGMDFATDELEAKRVARTMMAMTAQINDKLMPATGRDPRIRVRCVTCHRGIARPQQIDELLAQAAAADGVDAALARFDALRAEYDGSGAYDLSSGALAGLAETLAREEGDLDGATKVVRRNIELHPEDAHNQIMLGQLLLQKGDREGALAAMQRAVELAPDDEYAKRMLARVKGTE